MSFSPDKTKGRYSIKTDGKKEIKKERERAGKGHSPTLGPKGGNPGAYITAFINIPRCLVHCAHSAPALEQTCTA